jgi:hypothetical protein
LFGMRRWLQVFVVLSASASAYACAVPDVVFRAEDMPGAADASSGETTPESDGPASSTSDSTPEGACAPLCNDGVGCVNGDQCASGQCRNGVCGAPGCLSGALRCNNGDRCGANGDCGSMVCTMGKCLPPSCAPNCSTGAFCGDKSDCLPALKCKGVCM